jgi:hypothetical protein
MKITQKEVHQSRKELEEKVQVVQWEDYKSKVEGDIFILNCEVELWKKTLLDVLKYKAYDLNYELVYRVLELREAYNSHIPIQMRSKFSEITHLLVNMVKQSEEVGIETDINQLLEKYLIVQHKNEVLQKELMQEKAYSKSVQYEFMNLRGNVSIICKIRPFLDSESQFELRNNFINCAKYSKREISMSPPNYKE